MIRDRGGARPAAPTGEPAVVFEALADPTRRALMQTLSESGPATLAELSARLPVTRQAVSKHLATLREAGLVTPHGDVRGRRYELTPAPLADAVGWMMDVGAGWDERLARLKSLVESRRR
jgi:DNA-binding transcriptional ArsR family regulator